MGLAKPFKRTVRQLKDGSYKYSGNYRYIEHKDFAKSPEKYTRSFLLIQSDIQKLFEYVEPADINKVTYCYRIHELFMRVCIEVEANCKAILLENGYTNKKSKDLNMNDYRLIEKTHKLSKYKVILPRWDGKYGQYKPFSKWAKGQSLNWYQYYNSIKHDIHSNFRHANIKNMIEATCGLVVLLSAQFLNEDYSISDSSFIAESPNDGMDSAVGGYFRVKYPEWPEKDRYDFNWEDIKNDKLIFSSHDYNSL